MSETAHNDNKNTIAGFTTVQAYTLAVITLAIGIAVGYFARGSAPGISRRGERASCRTRRHGKRSGGSSPASGNRLGSATATSFA
jgi:hypothetical protein